MNRFDKWKKSYDAKHGREIPILPNSGFTLGKKIEPGVVSQSFIDKLRALGADEKWCRAMEFDNAVRQASQAIKKSREYWSCHYEQIVHEGCRAYNEVICYRPDDCPWHIRPLDIEVDYEGDDE